MAQRVNPWKRRKRERGPVGKELLDQVSRKKARSICCSDGIWLPLDAESSRLLERAGFGYRFGKGEAAKQHVRSLLSPDGSGDGSWVESILRVGPEEAFFLLHALGCLEMYRGTLSGDRMTPEDCWTEFCAQKVDFAMSYVAYSHFRSKGWLPKSGIQYGSDLVLYRDHPSVAHSEYAAIIMPMAEDIAALRKTRVLKTWNDLQTLSRLSVQVKKGLLILYVNVEKGTDLSTPACLDRFAVKELEVSRWSSEKNMI